jgi:L-threonylcarbamoyladenylate synthase
MDTIRTGTQPEDIRRAVESLHRGQVIAFPTDTVYGVGAHAMQPKAVEQLYVAKQRPRDKAIPLLLPDLDALAQVAVSVPDAAYALAERFWPGALTMILRRTPQIPDVVTAGGETVAVRIPDHPVTQALLVALNAPLAATSANLSGQPAPDTADGVWEQLAGRIGLLVDGGTCPGGVASTIVDLTTPALKVLRLGGISEQQLLDAIK